MLYMAPNHILITLHIVHVTHIEEILSLFDLVIPDLWHFQILRKRQFSSERPF